MEITWRDFAWYFEGEGCVGYYTCKSARGGWPLRLQISSTNGKLLKEMYRQLNPMGTFVTCGTHGGRREKCKDGRAKKPAWILAWTGKKAITVLERMVAYFPPESEKLPQIEFALRVGPSVDKWAADRMKMMKRLDQTPVKEDSQQSVLQFKEA